VEIRKQNGENEGRKKYMEDRRKERRSCIYLFLSSAAPIRNYKLTYIAAE